MVASFVTGPRSHIGSLPMVARHCVLAAIQNTCYLYYLLPVLIYWGLVDCPLSLVGIVVSVFTVCDITLQCIVLLPIVSVLTSHKL